MTKNRFFHRFFALFSALSLALPASVQALRNSQPKGNAGLEQKISDALAGSSAPAGGLETDGSEGERQSASIEYAERTQGPIHVLVSRLVQSELLRPGQAVLDVGSGTGVGTRQVADAVWPEGRVIGIDQSASLVEEASRRLADQPAVEFRQGEARQVSSVPEEVSIITAFNVVSDMSDEVLLDALRSWFEKLPPGGVLALNTGFYHGAVPTEEGDSLRYSRIIRAAVSRVREEAASLGLDRKTIRMPIPPRQWDRSPEEYRRILEEAGFRVVEAGTTLMELDVDTLKALFQLPSIVSRVLPDSIPMERRQQFLAAAVESVMGQGHLPKLSRNWLHFIARKPPGIEENRVEEALQLVEQRFRGHQSVQEAVADFRQWWLSLDLTANERRFAPRWSKAWSTLRRLKWDPPSTPYFVVRILSSLKNCLNEGVEVHRDPTKSRVPGTELLVDEGEPSSEDLEILAAALKQLQEVSPDRHRLVLEYTSVLSLYGERPNAYASILWGVPGWVELTSPFEGETRVGKVDVLYGSWIQEAAHHRFLELWPKRLLITEEGKEFEFPPERRSPLTDNYGPYSYLLEVDGHLSESVARLDLVRALAGQLDQRGRVENQLRWVERDAEEIKATLATLQGLLSPPDGAPEILTARGKERLDSLRKRWVSLVVWLSAAKATGMEALPEEASRMLDPMFDGSLDASDRESLLREFDLKYMGPALIEGIRQELRSLVPLLQRVLREDEDWEVRERAGRMLTAIGGPEAYAAIASAFGVPDSFTRDPEPQMRKALLRSLREFAESSSEERGRAWELLNRLGRESIGDPSEEVRREAGRPAVAPEPLSAEEFIARYGDQLGHLPDKRQRDIRRFLANDRLSLTDILVEDTLHLYTKGIALFVAVVSHLENRAPPGIRFSTQTLPPTAWSSIGLIFKEPRSEVGSSENPRGFPVLSLKPEEVSHLDPRAVVAAIFRGRLGIPESQEIFLEFFRDAQGRTHVLIFV